MSVETGSRPTGEKGGLQVASYGPANTAEHRGVLVTTGLFKHARETLAGMESAQEFRTMEPAQWETMNADTYGRYEGVIAELATRTRPHRIRLAGDTYEQEGQVEPEYAGAVKHIKVMQELTEELWDHGLSNLYPDGTTVHYAKAQVINHDIERFFGVNGTLFNRIDGIQVGLTSNEQPSEVFLRRAFPGLPQEYDGELADLHDMNYHTILQTLKDPESQMGNPQKLVLKVLDVFGKPDFRDPDTFFAPDGRYNGWLNNEITKGSMPFTVPSLDTPSYEARQAAAEAGITDLGRKVITAQDYVEVDRGLTEAGLKIIDNNFDVKFGDVLRSVCDRVSSDPNVVTNFGRASINR